MLKRILLATTLVLVLAFSTHAQQSQGVALDINQLILCEQYGPSWVNEKLLTKGWIFAGANKNDRSNPNCGFPEIYWHYKNSNGGNQFSSGFIKILKNGKCNSIVEYQIGNPDIYKNLLSEMKGRWQSTYISTKVQKSIYEGSTYVVDTYKLGVYIVEVSVMPSKNSIGENGNTYSFMLYKS